VDVVDDPGGVFCGADCPRTMADPMMRPTFAIAAIPLPVFGFAWILKPLPEKPIVPTPVITEGVRVIRLDTATFRARWSPIADLPPATVMVHVVERELVSTGGGNYAEAMPPVKNPPLRTIKRASLDTCTRHGMRKIWYGKRWRCRRA
jgi:hypothetical protein